MYTTVLKIYVDVRTCACVDMYMVPAVVCTCILLCTPSGLNLQATDAILQTNQLLQNWMQLQYPNLRTDFALAGRQLSRNPGASSGRGAVCDDLLP